MKKYLLLIKGSFAKWNALSEATKAEIKKEFGRFAGELGQQGYMLDGDGANERSLRITNKNMTLEQSLLPASTSDMVTGYFMIEVPSEEEAFKAAKKCPAFLCDEYVELVPCGDH